MRVIYCLLLTLFAFSTADAQDRGFIFDLTQPAQSQSFPSWINGLPVATPSAHASISFPITPPADQSDLAATFCFTESMGGFLRVYWSGAQSSEMLTDTLYEGIAMPNQRTLLIKRSSLTTSGTLTVQSSETTLDLSRIRFEWVDPTTVSLSPDSKQTAFVNVTGNALTEGEVNGAPLLPKADLVKNLVVTAVLSDKPVRIEGGVDFLATLQAMPQYARVEAKVSGAPVDGGIELIVNNAIVGDFAMDVPDLNDPGYQSSGTATTAAPAYFGWRKGVIFLPASQLKVGENQFQIRLKNVVPSGTSSPLAVKDLQLQLRYPEDTSSDQQPAATAQSTDTPAVPVTTGTDTAPASQP